MKTIPVSPRSKTLNALLNQARRRNIVLQAMDGQRFILTPIEKGVSGKVWVGFEVGEGDNEDITKNKDLMRFLSKRAERSKKKKLIPIEEVEKELGLKKRGG